MSKTLDFANVSYKAMKGVFPLWKDASSHTIRGMTRLLYDPVFCCGAVNQTGLTSVSALMEKTKPTLDHCLSPQFVARMIYDQPDIWLSEFDKFSYFYCILFGLIGNTILIYIKNKSIKKISYWV